MILCWGDVGWDDYEGETEPRPGGCALNVARSLALAGADVGIAGPIGEDGRPLLDLAAGWGIDTTAMEVLQGATPRQRIRLRADGERELCGHRAGALLGYTPGEVAQGKLVEAEIVYLPLWKTTLPWLELLRSLPRQGRLALDLMDLDFLEDREEDLFDDPFDKLIEPANFLFVSLNPNDPDHGDDLVGFDSRSSCGPVVVTLGAQGVHLFDDMIDVEVPACPPPGPLVDSTGCGDALAGAFLAQWLEKKDRLVWKTETELHAVAATYRGILRVACARAAEVATHRGAIWIGDGAASN